MLSWFAENDFSNCRIFSENKIRQRRLMGYTMAFGWVDRKFVANFISQPVTCDSLTLKTEVND
jgi:hypothetical protein